LLGVGWDWVHFVRRPLFGVLYQPQAMDDDERRAVGGIIGRGNWSTRRKSSPLTFCSLWISLELIWTWTRAAAVGSQWLRIWGYCDSINVSRG
jgi:hypothetical protein